MESKIEFSVKRVFLITIGVALACTHLVNSTRRSGSRYYSSGGYGGGSGYSGGYSSGSSYSQQASYAQQSQDIGLGQVSQSGTGHQHVEYEDLTDAELTDYGEFESMKINREEATSAENSLSLNQRAQKGWRSTPDVDVSGCGVVGGCGSGSARQAGAREGWSSSSSWSQSQSSSSALSGAGTGTGTGSGSGLRVGQQGLTESEIEALFQANQNQTVTTSGSGSLAPGHTYYYRRRSYNWTGTGKPVLCGRSSTTCNHTRSVGGSGRNAQQHGSQSQQVQREQQITQGQREREQQHQQGYVQQGQREQHYQQGQREQHVQHVPREQPSSQVPHVSTSGSVYQERQEEVFQEADSGYPRPTDSGYPRPTDSGYPRPTDSGYPRQPDSGHQRPTRHPQQPQPTAQYTGYNQHHYQERERQQSHYPTPTPHSQLPTARPTRQDTSRAEVQCANGIIKGQLITTELNKEVYAFLGIPFAKPPVGNLRFRRPEPVDNWDEPIIARTLPNACYQSNASLFPGNPGESQWNPAKVSEDCLYLNIWIPASIFRNRDQALSAVLFWIYGGGFFSGSSSLDIYNGAVLASEKDIIVVSTQYRVGPLGFLYLDSPDAPGNMGLLDQNLALKWVNKNIRYFGGNKDSITLMGESCGGLSVLLHLASPLSRNLFQRGIVMSGVSVAPYARQSNADAQRMALELARLVGCDNRRDKSEILQCLRNANPDAITSAQNQLFTSDLLYFPFVATVDGTFLPSCSDSLLDKSSAKRADIMIGSTKDEGTYFLMYAYRRYLADRSYPEITYDQFLEMISNSFDSTFSSTQTDAITNYYSNWVNPDDGRANLEQAGAAVNDGYFVCPTREFADMWAGRGLNVYQYHFTQRTSSNPWPEWMGVMHGDEIEYAFGVPLRDPERFTVDEKQLSIHFMDLLVRFAKTGVPSNNWQRYTEQRPTFLELNARRITDETSPNLGPLANQCKFWNKILPKVQDVQPSVSADIETQLRALCQTLDGGSGSGGAKLPASRSTTQCASASRRKSRPNCQC